MLRDDIARTQQDVRVFGKVDRDDALGLRLMAGGFGVGSALFAAGAVMSAVNWHGANATYALGAIFFTSAATVQWRTAVRHDPAHHSVMDIAERDFANPDWLAAVIQLLGTLYFNVMTIRALSIALDSPVEFNQEVWRPDMYGSAAFLISSAIALHPVARLRRHRLVRGRSRVIAWSNMAGSVFFGISAVAGKLIAPGTLNNAFWTNMGTFLGALMFLLAAVLLWPPHHQPAREAPENQRPRSQPQP